jgi:hypothetical protein
MNAENTEQKPRQRRYYGNNEKKKPKQSRIAATFYFVKV